MKYMRCPVMVDAEQFKFIDGALGPKTIKRAKELGLTQKGPYHIPTWFFKRLGSYSGIVHGDWIVIDKNGFKTVEKDFIFKIGFQKMKE